MVEYCIYSYWAQSRVGNKHQGDQSRGGPDQAESIAARENEEKTFKKRLGRGWATRMIASFSNWGSIRTKSW